MSAPVAPPDLSFTLPEALAAWGPPEARGVSRDGVRLLVSAPEQEPVHARFRDLARFLAPGDVLVVNASGTIAASLPARRREAHDRTALHLSTPAPGAGAGLRRWAVELRRVGAAGSEPLLDARAGERVGLPGGGAATLLRPYRPRAEDVHATGAVRLWDAQLELPAPVLEYAAAFGEPIRYRYVRGRWPLSLYQTVFAAEPGSAEMPSAGRPFTRRLLDDLARRGVAVAPLVLHTGVSSLESGEPPYPERYRIPARTAAAVNRARAAGGRVVAVGTTVVRALETLAEDGRARAGEGWTDLVITPERGLRVVDALLTGLHEPASSHLQMLSALADAEHLAGAYRAALAGRYLWHEFGDGHLILGERSPAARWPGAG
jgi:S-adenosylmethionine:tRNA ribosyltransferase-isomerase